MISATSIRLTPRQLDILIALRDYRRRHGYAPTMEELGEVMGTSKVTVFSHLNDLEKKGAIRRDRNKARSVEIVPGTLDDEDDDAAKLPLLGNISAGSPITCVDHREEIDLATMFHSTKGVYVLRVVGESLADLSLAHGDRLVVTRTEAARRGQLVVALDRAGLARVFTFEPPASGMRVMGAVLGMLRAAC